MSLKFYYEQKEIKDKWLDIANNKRVSTVCHIEKYSVIYNKNLNVFTVLYLADTRNCL